MTTSTTHQSRFQRGTCGELPENRVRRARPPAPPIAAAKSKPRPPKGRAEAWEADVNRVTIRACGNFCDCQEVLALHRRCRSRLRSGIAHLELDLTDVGRADTKLIACLVDLRRTARFHRVQMDITASVVVRQWINVCRLADLL